VNFFKVDRELKLTVDGKNIPCINNFISKRIRGTVFVHLDSYNSYGCVPLSEVKD